MSANDAVNCKFNNITATALINTGPTRLVGVFCASSTSGTLKVWDSTAASGTVCVNTFALTAGTFYQIPAQLQTGLFLTIANTADITVFWL